MILASCRRRPQTHKSMTPILTRLRIFVLSGMVSTGRRLATRTAGAILGLRDLQAHADFPARKGYKVLLVLLGLLVLPGLLDILAPVGRVQWGRQAPRATPVTPATQAHKDRQGRQDIQARKDRKELPDPLVIPGIREQAQLAPRVPQATQVTQARQVQLAQQAPLATQATQAPLATLALAAQLAQLAPQALLAILATQALLAERALLMSFMCKS
jgi:hypothetical protein